MKKIISILSMVAMIVILSSCSKEPVAEVEKANAAVENAKAVQADIYLSAEFTALTDSLNVVLAAIEAEKEKSASGRNFKPMTEKLTMIAAEADSLAANAEVVKAETRDMVQNEVTAITELLPQIKQVIDAKLLVKKDQAVAEALQSEYTLIEASLTEINTLVTNGDYKTAMEKVLETKSNVAMLNEKIAE